MFLHLWKNWARISIHCLNERNLIFKFIKVITITLKSDSIKKNLNHPWLCTITAYCYNYTSKKKNHNKQHITYHIFLFKQIMQKKLINQFSLATGITASFDLLLDCPRLRPCIFGDITRDSLHIKSFFKNLDSNQKQNNKSKHIQHTSKTQYLTI